MDTTEPKETSVDNGVQISARFIVQEAAKSVQIRLRMCQTLAERDATGMRPGTLRFNKTKLSGKAPQVKASRQPFDVSEG